MNAATLSLTAMLATSLMAACKTPIEGSSVVKLNSTSSTERTVPSLGPGKVWLNSRPLGPSDLRGKVVLVDIWNLQYNRCSGVPNGIRTRVAAVKGRCPRPLDDGDAAPAGRPAQ